MLVIEIKSELSRIKYVRPRTRVHKLVVMVNAHVVHKGEVVVLDLKS